MQVRYAFATDRARAASLSTGAPIFVPEPSATKSNNCNNLHRDTHHRNLPHITRFGQLRTTRQKQSTSWKSLVRVQYRPPCLWPNTWRCWRGDNSQPRRSLRQPGSLGNGAAPTLSAPWTGSVNHLYATTFLRYILWTSGIDCGTTATSSHPSSPRSPRS